MKEQTKGHKMLDISSTAVKLVTYATLPADVKDNEYLCFQVTKDVAV